MADSLDQLIMVEIWTYLSFFFWYRRVVKWLLHFGTGSCELQRICYKAQYGAPRTSQVEYSLRNSKIQALNELPDKQNADISQAVQMIMSTKKIDIGKEKVFYDNMLVCLKQICGYTDLIKTINEYRKERYNSDNKDHEKKLLKLWELMMPGTKLENRITSQWGDIGFQGKDPMTDFRGMGMLGMDNLLYFASNHSSAARKVLSNSHHPSYGYSYAIVGINITGMAFRLLEDGSLRNHFYNCKHDKPSPTDFHEVYCYLLYEFNSFWMIEKPASVMEFNKYKDLFEEKIGRMLKDTNVRLILKHSTIDQMGSLTSLNSLDTHF
ncbi:ELMO domain-containing protein 2 isoform X1 [Nematostella vectensis]|uniref:ELMO domain-containing protein 2 isoform X1 n=2 Tax=Nematostella vectensis TaxID=45351 RepID=UPI002076E37E|nr:ELMO domain-containing protein 2 isoform X1 [Nematostella vectensis]